MTDCPKLLTAPPCLARRPGGSIAHERGANMKEWFIWIVKLVASWFMLLTSLVLVIFLFTTEDKAVTGGLAAMFGLAGYVTLPRMPNAWKRDPPSAKQLAYAEKLGIPIAPGMTKGEVSSLISQVTGR